MITGKELGKIAQKMRKPEIKARKGDICLTVFTSCHTTKDYKTTRKDYYKFCTVAHCDRAGRVIQVHRKNDNALYPAGNEIYMVPAEKCGGLNLVHYLGDIPFNTVREAIDATKALFAIHNVATA